MVNEAAPVIDIRQALRAPMFSPPRAHASVVYEKLIRDGALLRYNRATGPHYDSHSAVPLSSSPALSVASPEGGEMRFPAWPTRHHSNRHGSMHGGFIACAIDALCATHLFAALGRWREFKAVTAHLNVNYLRPVPIVLLAAIDGPTDETDGIVFHTKLSRLGRRTANFTAWVTRASSREVLVQAQLLMVFSHAPTPAGAHL